MDGDNDDLLLLILLDHTIPIELSAAEYFRHIVCRFGVDGYPGEHGNAFGYSGQMGEKGRCSIGFSDVIDSTHHGLQVLQDLHVDWGLDIRFPGSRGDNKEFAFCSKGSQDSSRLVVRVSMPDPFSVTIFSGHTCSATSPPISSLILTKDLTCPFMIASKSSMTGGSVSMCLEGGLACSRAGCADGPWPDRAWAASVVSEGSPILGTRSSRREVAASSLPSIVSASLAGRVEGILGASGLKGVDW